MNVARLNFSHGSHAEHEERLPAGAQGRRARPAVAVGVLADLQGPKIRLGQVRRRSRASWRHGDEFTITTDDVPGDRRPGLARTYKGLPGDVKPGRPDPDRRRQGRGARSPRSTGHGVRVLVIEGGAGLRQQGRLPARRRGECPGDVR